MLEQRAVTIATPIGTLKLTATERGITSLAFVEERVRTRGDNECLRAGKRQIEEYFAGERRAFHDLPLALVGTAFAQDVWAKLMSVPFGATRTYGEIAADLSMEGSARAVGGAVGRNPLAIIVPCHRILPSDGSLGGFAWGEERKKWLLEHEKNMHSFLSFSGRERK